MGTDTYGRADHENLNDPLRWRLFHVATTRLCFPVKYQTVGEVYLVLSESVLPTVYPSSDHPTPSQGPQFLFLSGNLFIHTTGEQ